MKTTPFALLIALLALSSPAVADSDLQSAINRALGPSLNGYSVYPAPRSDHGIGYAYVNFQGASVPICQTILPSDNVVQPGALTIPSLALSSNGDISGGLNLVSGIIANVAGLSADLEAHGYTSVTVSLTNVREYVIPLPYIPGGGMGHVPVLAACKTTLQQYTQNGSTELKHDVYIVFKALGADGITFTFSKGIGAPPAPAGTGHNNPAPAPATPPAAAPAAPAADANATLATEAITVISNALKPAPAAGGAAPPAAGTNPKCMGAGASVTGTLFTAKLDGNFCVGDASTVSATTDSHVWLAYQLQTYDDIGDLQ